jgi:hypothetical protein
MAQINENYLKLKAGYLFPEIGRRVRAFAVAHPEAKVIRMGIGDVTEPLAPAIVAAMHKAVDEMARRETFKVRIRGQESFCAQLAFWALRILPRGRRVDSNASASSPPKGRPRWSRKRSLTRWRSALTRAYGRSRIAVRMHRARIP